MCRSDFNRLTKLFTSRQVNGISLMKTLRLHIIVIEPHSTCLIITNKYLELMLLLLNSIYGVIKKIEDVLLCR